MMDDLIVKARSYRRFRQQESIDDEMLKSLVNLGRLSPSGGNLQPLKFMVANTPERNAQIFPYLAWAGYLTDWPGPDEGERPAAYIVILGDTRIKPTFDFDAGIAAQSMVLGAAERGIGACMIGSIQREKLRQAFAIPEYLEVVLVLALGSPAEKVVLDAVGADGRVEYWRDGQGVHHVPKRTMEEVLFA